MVKLERMDVSSFKRTTGMCEFHLIILSIFSSHFFILLYFRKSAIKRKASPNGSTPNPKAKKARVESKLLTICVVCGYHTYESTNNAAHVCHGEILMTLLLFVLCDFADKSEFLKNYLV